MATRFWLLIFSFIRLLCKKVLVSIDETRAKWMIERKKNQLNQALTFSLSDLAKIRVFENRTRLDTFLGPRKLFPAKYPG